MPNLGQFFSARNLDQYRPDLWAHGARVNMQWGYAGLFNAAPGSVVVGAIMVILITPILYQGPWPGGGFAASWYGWGHGGADLYGALLVIACVRPSSSYGVGLYRIPCS